MVRPSWVTQKGTPLGPTWTRLTLPNLNCRDGRIREGQDKGGGGREGHW